MNNCIFCKIINGDIPSDKVFENDKVLAFKDINPQSKVHVLVIPKIHIESINSVDDTNIEYASEVLKAIPIIAKAMGIVEDGYRVISNCGENAGQTVMHFHFHILGGKEFGEKLF